MITDWWKPDPSDPFWMLEDEGGAWLRNQHSQVVTRDASKAIRFPSEWHADVARKGLVDMGWLKFRPTEHTWIALAKATGEPS